MYALNNIRHLRSGSPSYAKLFETQQYSSHAASFLWSTSIASGMDWMCSALSGNNEEACVEKQAGSQIYSVPSRSQQRIQTEQ